MDRYWNDVAECQGGPTEVSLSSHSNRGNVSRRNLFSETHLSQIS